MVMIRSCIWKEVEWIWHGYARYGYIEGKMIWKSKEMEYIWIMKERIVGQMFYLSLFKNRKDVTGLKENGVNYDTDICWLLYI